MLRQNTCEILDPLREQLAKASAEFLAKGGKVQQLAITDRKPEPKGNLRQRSIATTRIHGCSRRELEQRDQELAKRAQALANSGLPSEEIRKRIALGPIAFGQFIARHGISLPKRSKA